MGSGRDRLDQEQMADLIFKMNPMRKAMTQSLLLTDAVMTQSLLLTDAVQVLSQKNPALVGMVRAGRDVAVPVAVVVGLGHFLIGVANRLFPPEHNNIKFLLVLL